MPSTPQTKADLESTAASAAQTEKAPDVVRVRVPQESGPITITLTPGTKDVRRFTVTDHVVEAETQRDADLLLLYVEGSALDK